jgi:hypothetical protein
MIIRETTQSYVFVAQHDHATLSGQLAAHWKEESFWRNAYNEDTLLAIYEHDRGWLGLDNSPALDEETQKPYSFLNYPPEKKLAHYQLGVNEVEVLNPYAAILCGLHYVSFMKNNTPLETAFIAHEQARQHRLKDQLQLHAAADEVLLQYHFHLLQFFDDLSLYLCMNQPGVSKQEEYPFFQQGFKNTDFFAFTGGKKIEASWKTRYMVAVQPFPFMQEVEASIFFRQIQKSDIALQGLSEAYRQAPIQEHMVSIIP